MFVDQDGVPVDGLSCGPAPRVRPPWCRTRFLTINDEPSMTQQSDVDQTDVDAIVARFERTGELPMPMAEKAQYGDVTELQVDLTEAINRSRANIQTTREFGENWTPAEPEPQPDDTPPEPTPPAAA